MQIRMWHTMTYYVPTRKDLLAAAVHVHFGSQPSFSSAFWASEYSESLGDVAQEMEGN